MKEDESEEDENMKKTYKIDVDCANCANKMEEAAKNTTGVKDATVNFMTLKMILITATKSCLTDSDRQLLEKRMV